jgi:hypothetical protein
MGSAVLFRLRDTLFYGIGSRREPGQNILGGYLFRRQRDTAYAVICGPGRGPDCGCRGKRRVYRGSGSVTRSGVPVLGGDEPDPYGVPAQRHNEQDPDHIVSSQPTRL